MIMDIHSHINLVDDTYDVHSLLEDMNSFHIEQRVISYLGYDEIQKHTHQIAQLVRAYPDRLIGCALINPCLTRALEDVKEALSLPEIKMIEFNSFEHGYYPDSCKALPAIFEEMNKKKITVKIFSGLGAKSLPQQWTYFVENYPNINFIFLHMGCFDYGYGCIDMVKKYKNAFVETSNQYELQIVRKAFTQLPKEKIIFGSCYPERFTRNAIEIFDLYDLSEEDLRNITYENAKRMF